MTPEFFLSTSIKGAFKLLPPAMDTPSSKAMVLAICLQESKLQFRKQVGGPARGYAQFEQGGGVTGVLTHPSSASHTKIVCAALDILPTPIAIYTALEHNDVLVAALARLLLWTLPGPMPPKSDPDLGWSCYISAWRPGKPHRETWNANFAEAWSFVEMDQDSNKLSIETLKVKDAAIALVQSLDTLQSSVKDLLAHP